MPFVIIFNHLKCRKQKFKNGVSIFRSEYVMCDLLVFSTFAADQEHSKKLSAPLNRGDVMVLGVSDCRWKIGVLGQLVDLTHCSNNDGQARAIEMEGGMN